jgi:hypothetical protein
MEIQIAERLQRLRRQRLESRKGQRPAGDEPAR